MEAMCATTNYYGISQLISLWNNSWDYSRKLIFCTISFGNFGYDAKNFTLENKILNLSIDAVHITTNSKININSSILALNCTWMINQKGQHDV